MPEPGVYVQELPGGPQTIAGAATSIAAFVGRAADGPLHQPGSVTAFADYERVYGAVSTEFPMSYAVRDFFVNGGSQAMIARVADAQSLPGDRSVNTGIYQLDSVPAFNILCIPPDEVGGDTAPAVYQAAAAYCAERRAMLIADPPVAWAAAFRAGKVATIRAADLGITDETARHAAVYFPRVLIDLGNGSTAAMAVCGAIAGVWAATDVSRGVWQAPAGIQAPIGGIAGLECRVTDADSAVLNPVGINCLREFPMYGPVVWGARTLRGGDELSEDYKYIPVRRLVDFIENSIVEGTKWAVFEPN